MIGFDHILQCHNNCLVSLLNTWQAFHYKPVLLGVFSLTTSSLNSYSLKVKGGNIYFVKFSLFFFFKDKVHKTVQKRWKPLLDLGLIYDLSFFTCIMVVNRKGHT